MQKLLFIILLPFLIACHTTNTTTMGTSQSAVLSQQEQNEGWKLLFDGQTTNGWHTYGKSTIGKAWKVVDGTLYFDAASKKSFQTPEGGDIVTNEEFENFHLKLDWKISPNGNSGIMFYVHEDPVKYSEPWHTGPEMQVLDNNGHPDAKILTHRAGDLYDLIAAKENVRPVGEWNEVEIIANRGDLKFFMNGEQVLQTTMWDDNWREMVAKSKFKDKPGFGTYKKGRILLQDHSDDVWYRNIKIREL
jgi:hypothetical protein